MSLLLPIIYVAFVSLGLPDSLLGSAWPVMHGSLGVAVASGGVVSMIIAGGTIVSSLMTDRLVRRLGTGRLTAASVALTAVSLAGFSTVTSFWQLCLWAVPYGLGAGAVDAALNAFVAVRYEARHMNWLHCCWGIGASTGPAIMGAALGAGLGWPGGYRIVALIQVALVVVLVATLGLWADRGGSETAGAARGQDSPAAPPLTRNKLFGMPGVREVLVAFFCYSAIESAMGLWGGTFLVEARSVPAETAAFMVSLFYLGITGGRFVSGLLTLRLSGQSLLHLGEALMLAGMLVLAVAGTSQLASGAGLVLVGLGCAPVYPQIIQLTPVRFGDDAARSLMGLQMACAYTGSVLFPPLCGLVMQNVSPALLPALALGLLGVMSAMQELCDHKVRGARKG